MKSNVIIRMGAAAWTVTVRGADGKPGVFDLRAMDKERRRRFHRTFMQAYRQSAS